MNSENKLCQNGKVSHCKLKEFGVKFPSHLSNRLPDNYIVIGCMKTEFFEAVQQLNKQDVIGLSLEGCDIGRSGSLEWLNISSSTCTYLFHISSLGSDAFDEGLKMLLENKRIVKVVHDCRRAADCLFHQYNTKPVNVYDTQVADFVVNAIKKNVELITNNVNSLNYCLKLYLTVPGEYLCKHFNGPVKQSSLPLNHDLLQFLVKNVIYLRMLKQELDMILRMPFRRCIDVYLQVILKKSDQELQLHQPDFKLVPPELVIENMQVFKLTDKLKPPESSKLENKEDPFTRYERDCRKYQQKYGYGKYADDKELEGGLGYENVDGGWSYSNRSEIIQFLLDKMFSCDSSDRSVYSMTPFENLSERDDCSVTPEEDLCNMSIGHNLKHGNKVLPVPNCTFKGSYPTSKPLQSTTHINPSFENLTSSDRSWMSPEDVNTPVVDIKLPNDITLPDPGNLKSTESVSSESSFSRKSHLLFARKDSNDVKNLVCDNSSSSSLSGKSQVHGIFAEQEGLLASQKHLPNKSTIPAKESINDIDLFSERKNSKCVKESVSDSLSDSSSVSQLTYKLFAKHPLLLDGQNQLARKSITSGKDSISDAGILSADVYSNGVKESVCDTSLKATSSSGSSSHKRSPLSDKVMRLLSSKSHSSSADDSVTDIDMQSSEYSVRLNQRDSFKNVSSNEGNSASSDAGHFNSCHLDGNNLTTSAVIQDEDPWTRLRGAFAELGPERYSKEKIVFIPAGMQY